MPERSWRETLIHPRPWLISLFALGLLRGARLAPDVTSDHHGLPTPRSTLCNDRGALVLVWCKLCQHRTEADLQKLIAEGSGDVPLIHLPFRCRCGSRRTGIICSTAYGGRPVWNRDGTA